MTSRIHAAFSRTAESGRTLLAPRPRRLATGPVPAAFIVVTWLLLWAWVTLGVMAPLSRLGSPERARAASEIALLP